MVGSWFIYGSASWKMEQLPSIKLCPRGLKYKGFLWEKKDGAEDSGQEGLVLVQSLCYLRMCLLFSFSFSPGQILHRPQLPGTSPHGCLLKTVMLVFNRRNLQKFTCSHYYLLHRTKGQGVHIHPDVILWFPEVLVSIKRI